MRKVFDSSENTIKLICGINQDCSIQEFLKDSDILTRNNDKVFKVGESIAFITVLGQEHYTEIVPKMNDEERIEAELLIGQGETVKPKSEYEHEFRRDEEQMKSERKKKTREAAEKASEEEKEKRMIY
jgi:hypothetical protein